MSLSDLASLGSFISGVAILVSFVFLALQMRQSNINQRAQIQAARTARVTDVLYRQIEPHMRDVILRGRRGDATMSPEEIEAFVTATYAAFMNFQDTFLQARAGTIDPSAWKDASARLKNIFAAPGMRVSWKRRKDYFGPDFVAVVDQIVSQARLTAFEEPSASWASDVAEEKRLAAS